MTWDAATGETLISVNTSELPAGSFSNHYLEFAEGPQAGLNLDITSNTNGQIRVEGNATSEGLTSGDRVIVRSHATMGTAFPDGSGLVPFVDTVSLFNSSGGRTDLFWNSAGNFWMDVFGIPHDDEVIYPGEGFLIFASQDTTITFGGSGALTHVKTTPTLFLAEAGTINLVGASNPFFGDSTPLVDLGLGATFDPFRDSASLFSADGNLNIVGTYLSDGGLSDPTTVTFIDGSGTNSSAVPVPNGASLSIGVLEDKFIHLPPSLVVQ